MNSPRLVRLAAGAAFISLLACSPAFSFCDSAVEAYAIFQCADLAYFAPLPAPYSKADVGGVFWQLGFGNRTVQVGTTIGDGTGTQGPGSFPGNDSGILLVDLLDGNALDSRFPAGSICLGSNNWANAGVDGCPDNPRAATFTYGGQTYQGNDNHLNPYFNVSRAYAGYPGYYTLAAQADYPTAVLLTTSDEAIFAVAAVASADRDNDGSGDNGPCAPVPGNNPAPCDLSQGFFPLAGVTDGLPNAIFPSRSNVIPWQQTPGPIASSVTAVNPNDPASDLLVDLVWNQAHVHSDLSVRPSTNPTLAPADPNAAPGVGVSDLLGFHGSLVRYTLETALVSDPGFTSIVQSITCPGDPECASAGSASFTIPTDSCVRIRTLFGLTPRTTVLDKPQCRLGRCGDLGFGVTSTRICFLPNCVPEAESCDGLDNDCDGDTDEDFGTGDSCVAAGVCGAGVVECADLTTTRCSTEPGGSQDGSSPETCDGLDNDCDGGTDEDFGAGMACDGEGACGIGVFECAGPTAVRCSTEPGGSQDQSVPEFCDGLDNDCDGVTDESNEPEVCDLQDNDCDGQIDEGFGTGAVCDGEGACGVGVVECATTTTTQCSTEPGGSQDQSSAEICDGLDNDCDAVTDEPFPIGQACTGLGECGAGFVECASPTSTRCSTESGGSQDQSSPEICDGLDNDCDGGTDEEGVPEICDGLDNDCDFLVDEDFGVGNACTPPGICGEGILECFGPTASVCSTGPGGSADQSQPEACDSLDNDCDGATDEDWLIGGLCYGEGACGRGHLECADSSSAICSSDPGGSQDRSREEKCDSRDNDCDGLTDEDSLGLDADGDGIPGVCDNCPGIPNSSQEDADGDAAGDVCDICPSAFDPGQEDGDLDGEGDVCDVNDGIIVLSLPGAQVVDYQEEAIFLTTNIYRSEMDLLRSAGLYTQDPGTVAGADQFCGETGGVLSDPFVPSVPGQVLLYLGAGVDAGGEKDLGQDSSGAPRPNDFPCP